MGACYSVCLKYKMKDDITSKTKAKEILQEFVHSERANFGLSEMQQIGVETDTVEDLIRICLAGWSEINYDHSEIRDEDGKWFEATNDFDAAYGWEGVMIDMFNLIAPYLVDGSNLFIDIDNDYDEINVVNGKCIQLH